MNTKELKRLSRMDLLQVLLRQTQEVDRLKAENEELRQQLECRTLQIAEAGNIAEASLKINRVMEAAQAAAQQYLDNLHRLSDTAQHNFPALEEKTLRRCQAMEEETKSRCQAMELEATRKCVQMELAAQRKCDEMLGIARTQAARTPQKKKRKKSGR